MLRPPLDFDLSPDFIFIVYNPSLYRQILAVTSLVIFQLLFFEHSTAAAVSVSIGQNFTGSSYELNSSALPPDSNGAIGPRHFMEFVNGTVAVYNKTNGLSVQRKTNLKFWADAGVIISADSDVSDPRVIFDPTVQRWFALQVDFNAAAASGDPTLNANDFLLAVSATSDPTGVWHGFLFQADPDTGTFADFPTLGLDANAVYISGDMYQGELNPLGAGLVSIPKADLLLNPPVIANRTWFGVMDYAERGQVLQPAICFDGGSSGAVLAIGDIGYDSFPHSNVVMFAVLNSASPTASLSASTNLIVTPYRVPDNLDLGVPQFNVSQPDGTTTLQANDARLSSKVYSVGGVLYAVHSTQVNNHIAIRWYRINATNHIVIESDTIADPNLDLFFPSIAANGSGAVVIGYNGASTDTFVSCYASVGETVNGVTAFGSPILLQSGAVSYHDLGEIQAQLLMAPVVDSRWGDYSATSVDPNNPSHFWTIQMYPSGTGSTLDEGIWSTQITELIVLQPPLLTIVPQGTNVLVSWPVSASGFHLQTTTNLMTTNTWFSVSQTLFTNGSQISALVPRNNSSGFYRMKSP